jgi:hypothetical protein
LTACGVSRRMDDIERAASTQQPLTDQDPVDGPLRRNPDSVVPPRQRPAQQLKPDPARTPPRMLPPHLGHRDLHHLSSLMRTRLRPMRTIRQPADSLHQIACQPTMQRRPMHPGPRRYLSNLHARQHRPHRVQTLLHNRQDNQCQSRSPRVRNAPRRRSDSECRSQPVSHINCRTRVAYQPTEHKPPHACTAESTFMRSRAAR